MLLYRLDVLVSHEIGNFCLKIQKLLLRQSFYYLDIPQAEGPDLKLNKGL